jgi:putative transposase
MPRVARLVVEGIAHHVTQRGNRCQDVFFSDEDRRRYLAWLKDYAERYGLGILGYCLMTNHVHLVGLPERRDSLARTLQTTHMRYAQRVNLDEGWNGHLWQGRYFSTALDEAHEWAAVRYVEQNPVRAGLVERAEDYPWSSAAFHLGTRDDRIVVKAGRWGGPVEGWAEALDEAQSEEMLSLLRARTCEGRPCGDEAFIAKVSALLGRDLSRRPNGRPRKT